MQEWAALLSARTLHLLLLLLYRSSSGVDRVRKVMVCGPLTTAVTRGHMLDVGAGKAGALRLRRFVHCSKQHQRLVHKRRPAASPT